MATDNGSTVGRMKLGSQGLEVSRQGLGCMGMSALHGPPKPESDMISLIHHAIGRGVTFLDTADAYGPFTNELLLGKALAGSVHSQAQLATKFGISVDDGKIDFCGDPAYVRAACEASLKRLGVPCIDLYYQHRVDTRIPIEVTIGELKKLVEEGKIKYIGISEALPSTIRRAHAVYPITAVQLEWSLWTRDVEAEIIPTCRELGIGVVAYSPLGRGFLASGPKIANNLSEQDSRKVFILMQDRFLVGAFLGESFFPDRFKSCPRFQPGNIEKNAVIFQRVNDMAKRKGCTPSQLALAWVQHQGEDVCPIPGTTEIDNLDQNIGALSVKLTPEEMVELKSCASLVNGHRYESNKFTWSQSETPPLSSWRL